MHRRVKMNNLYISPELIKLILLRLPVISVIRFKCVCKSWFSLISDPQFGISHFDLASASPPSRRLLLKSTEVSVHSFDMDFGQVHLTLPPPSHSPALWDDSSFYAKFHGEHWVLGSCRGIVVLNYQAKSNELILWNPSTGVYKRFPFHACRDLYKGYLYGFGYDTATDDYLLALIHLANDAQFFSFKTNSWNTVDGVDVEYVNDDPRFRPGTLVNGALHWLVSRELVLDDFEDLVFVIIAFDLTQRTLSEIHLFNDFTNDKYQIYGLRECRGRLTLCCSVLGSGTAEIWMMIQDEFLATWSRAMVIPGYNYFCPLSMTIDDRVFGSNLTLSLTLEKREHNGELVMYDRVFYGHRFNCPNLQSAIYTESLLPLPVSLVGDDQQ